MHDVVKLVKMFTSLGKILVQLGLLKMYLNPPLGSVVDQIGIDNHGKL